MIARLSRISVSLVALVAMTLVPLEGAAAGACAPASGDAAIVQFSGPSVGNAAGVHCTGFADSHDGEQAPCPPGAGGLMQACSVAPAVPGEYRVAVAPDITDARLSFATRDEHTLLLASGVFRPPRA